MWNRVPCDTKANHVVEPARFAHALRVVELLVPLRLVVLPERPVAAEFYLWANRRVKRLLRVRVVLLTPRLLIFLLFFRCRRVRCGGLRGAGRGSCRVCRRRRCVHFQNYKS